MPKVHGSASISEIQSNPAASPKKLAAAQANKTSRQDNPPNKRDPRSGSKGATSTGADGTGFCVERLGRLVQTFQLISITRLFKSK
jgi:hypothetical protein